MNYMHEIDTEQHSMTPIQNARLVERQITKII